VTASLSISCEDCVARDTDACADCVVSFICDREPGDAVITDVAEDRPVRLLGQAGLVPAVRHKKKTG